MSFYYQVWTANQYGDSLTLTLPRISSNFFGSGQPSTNDSAIAILWRTWKLNIVTSDATQKNMTTYHFFLGRQYNHYRKMYWLGRILLLRTLTGHGLISYNQLKGRVTARLKGISKQRYSAAVAVWTMAAEVGWVMYWIQKMCFVNKLSHTIR